jgi:hypothetical protein
VSYGLSEQGQPDLPVRASRVSFDSSWGAGRAHLLERVRANAARLWKTGMLEVWRPLSRSGPAWDAAFVALGLLGVHGVLRRGAWHVPTFVALYGFGLLSVLVHPRLLVPLVPFALILVAAGCTAGIRFARQALAIRGGAGWARAFGGVFALGAVSLLAAAAASAYAWAGEPRNPFELEPLAQKEAAVWMRLHLDQSARMISHNPQTAYYFYEGWPFEQRAALPWAEPAQVLEYARARGTDYIVLEEWIIRAAHFPVEPWLDETPPELSLVHVFGAAPYRVYLLAQSGADSDPLTETAHP